MAAVMNVAHGEYSEHSDRLAALRVEADTLRHKYRAVSHDESLSYSEQIAALSVLAKEMQAVLTEAQRLIYS